jgi:hypothetical protein
MSAEGCEGALQLPYVNGSEPSDTTLCGATRQDKEKESIWKKWFGKKN